MPDFPILNGRKFDRTNVVLAALVFVVSFIVYALTVQRSIPFWDCGEFIACSAILGIPHPPGTPLFVLIGRLFAMIPFVTDVAYRVNYISVISSAFTAMLSYLLVVKIVRYFFDDVDTNALSRWIAYIGGVAGAFFVAFSETNWSNAVEAEVYGLSLALMVLIVWLTVEYFEHRGTGKAVKMMVLAFYLALVGVGIHMTVFLVMPMCAVFFLLKKNALPRDFLFVCGYVLLELLLIVAFSNGRGGQPMFFLFSAIASLALLALLYKEINWPVAIAIGCVSSIMVAFEWFLIFMPIGLVAIILIALMASKRGWNVDWKPALTILVIALIGFSVHLYLPIRSADNPRIDENHPARDYRTFVSFLDRKQYGQQSMTERMFKRRGTWENQFGRHPNMGFWSYFEGQYSKPGWLFIFPFFLLGMIGMYVAIQKRREVGLPFFTLFIACSVGLILYMNFADGTKYDFQTGDAYLEVRNRDYFFTPAFVFFGIAMGMGVSGVAQWFRKWVVARKPEMESKAVYATTLLVLLPLHALDANWRVNDRSHNVLARTYAQNILDSCDQNAILFTSGDNDTFPVWCLQEAYNYRKDVRVVNLSLLQVDWYVYQLKHFYNVPISLSDEQILWYPVEVRDGVEFSRPRKTFNDRPRKRETYMSPYQMGNRIVRVSEMMVDEIVIENRWKDPIFFSSPPYAESPLSLRDHAAIVGMVYRLDKDPIPGLIDVDRSYDLFMNTYKFTGMENSKVYRDENATGVYISLGMSALRVFDEENKRGREEQALALANKMIAQYPEYWQTYMVLGDYYDKKGDTTKANGLYQQLIDTLSAFSKASPDNLFYRQDLGLARHELGRRLKDQAMTAEGTRELWDAFMLDPNSSYGFRKLISVLSQDGKFTDLQKAAQMFAEYKVNLSDPFLQRILGISNTQGLNPPTE
ncbi:MAG: DUF2723 domain-containing protein [Candidatus Zixiibacteriota bacterium]